MLFDPTRDRVAFEEVESWNARLQKQLAGRRAIKLLVGTKRDVPDDALNMQRIERLVREGGFLGYFETSARTGHGVPELRRTLARSLRWQDLVLTYRPELFQRIRDEAGVLRRDGATATRAGLEARIREGSLLPFDPQAVGTIVKQATPTA